MKGQIMQAGNAFYRTAQDIPTNMPILSLASVVLLPGGFIAVQIDEAQNIRLADEAMRTNRLIGLVQPAMDNVSQISVLDNGTRLCDVGCIARITSYSEVGDGNILISLHGVCRFRIASRIVSDSPYLRCKVSPFFDDLIAGQQESDINRDAFLSVFQDYLEFNQIDADWDTILEASNETLINAMSTLAPFRGEEKQALLEAPDLKTRSETLIAIAERSILGHNSNNHTNRHSVLQ